MLTSDVRDLVLLNGATFIPMGALEACFQVQAADDDVAEDDEEFSVIFEAANPKDVVNGSTLVTISDNDGMARFSFLYSGVKMLLTTQE